MPSATDRLEFGPPRDAGSLRALGLALLAHVLLIAALTWGVNWKSSDKAASFEAELWSSVPQQAAPRLVEAPPPPPPPPQPTAAPQARPEPPPAPEVDIALEQEKKRKLQREREQAEAEKAAEKAAERKAELAAQKKKRQEELDKQAKEDLKAEQAKRKAAEDAKKAEAKKQDQQEEKQKQAQAAAAAKQRQDAMNRMMGLAGASGNADAKGTGLKSSGPSASYGGKVRAAVKPNVVFTDDVVGNPKAEVEVRTTADGTITSRRVITSSGNASWDAAVLKAIDRTQVMPRDVDGRVPSPMILEFRPKD